MKLDLPGTPILGACAPKSAAKTPSSNIFITTGKNNFMDELRLSGGSDCPRAET
ncbi:hypothetical protein [Brevundimonas variabilis]|uniref:hypothetical protein n=1 Tax=Brevundimonas variabilis TaxID=74312 RepID=UPI001605B0BD|nr:hypothetical protein [Brevundimonas variabilis]